MENKIKEVIKERGISQKDLCSMIGMSEVGMSKAVNGSATRETLEKVANALQIDVEELIVDNVLFAKYSAEKTPLMLGNIALPCYVLNNGMRVFSGRGIQKAIGNNSKSGQWIKSFCNTDGLGFYLRAGQNSVTDRLLNPIKFKRRNAGGSQSITYGYEATLLIDLCSAVIDASRAGVYNDPNTEYNCDVIIRAVAKTGIIALVDEATGYVREKGRAKDELQKFLFSFISQEAAKWVKTFPDQFFEDVYKMRNWTWAKATAKPSFVGKIINDIVYERIAPLVYEELKRLNPKSETGNRRYKFHQFLTSDVGKPKLQNHLAVLHSFALASDYDWARFMYLLDKACPKKYQELALFDEFDEV